MSLSLDDLRHPALRSRLRGYDRDEVDRLLAMVVEAVGRLERRRQGDAEDIERLSRELATARRRAEDVERRAAALHAELKAADWAESEAAQRADEWERRTTEALQRAEQAERALALGHAEPAPGEGPVPRLPVAHRAARAVLHEARIQAAAIVRQAEERAAALAGDNAGEDSGEQDRTEHDSEEQGGTPGSGSGAGYDNRSGSSATIQS